MSVQNPDDLIAELKRQLAERDEEIRGLKNAMKELRVDEVAKKDEQIKELIKFKNEEINTWTDAYMESERARSKERSKFLDQIHDITEDKYKYIHILNEVEDESNQLYETKLNLQREISFKDDIIKKLREIIAATLYKQKKDADGIDEIFDKDFDEYDILVTDALELDTE
jgi:hypothetical protein